MPTFLFKTEPSEYSFDDLLRDRSTTWSGVTSPAALKALRACRKGDEVLVYHTGSERAIVGLARVSSNPYEDPSRPGRDADGLPKSPLVDVKAVKRVPSPVTLAAIKADPRFAEFALVRQSRLSVMPVPDSIDAALRKSAGL